MVLVVAAGCSDPDVKLRGKREPVTAILTDGGAQLNAPQENQSRSFEAPAQKNNLSWPQGHGTPKTRTTHPALAAALAKAWSASIGRGDRQRARISADPIVVDGMIVTLDSQSVLVATSASGARLWSLDLTPVGEQPGEADGGGIASGGGRIYVTTGYGEMAAVDPKTGEKIWSQSLMALAAGRPFLTSWFCLAMALGMCKPHFAKAVLCCGRPLWPARAADRLFPPLAALAQAL